MRRYARGFGIAVKHAGRFTGEYDGGASLSEARKRAREDFAAAPEIAALACAEVWIVRFSFDGERRYLVERVTA